MITLVDTKNNRKSVKCPDMKEACALQIGAAYKPKQVDLVGGKNKEELNHVTSH